MVMLTDCWVAVIGGVKEIDWFSPSGEKIEPGRTDVSVVRTDETASTLTIYNAKVDQAGTYKCVATSGKQEAESTVNLKIYRKILGYSESVHKEYWIFSFKHEYLGKVSKEKSLLLEIIRK